MTCPFCGAATEAQTCPDCGRDRRQARAPCTACGQMTPVSEATCSHCGQAQARGNGGKYVAIFIMFVVAIGLSLFLRIVLDL